MKLSGKENKIRHDEEKLGRTPNNLFSKKQIANCESINSKSCGITSILNFYRDEKISKDIFER